MRNTNEKIAEAVLCTFTSTCRCVEESGIDHSEIVEAEMLCLIEAHDKAVEDAATFEMENQRLADENKKIKSWAQAQHDADGEAIKKLDGQIKKMRNAYSDFRFRVVNTYGGQSPYLHAEKADAVILASPKLAERKQ